MPCSDNVLLKATAQHDRRETAVLCCGLEKNGMVRAWHGRGMASVNQTRPHCVNQIGKTHSKPLAARHGRGTGWARYAMCESAFKGCVNVLRRDVSATAGSTWKCHQALMYKNRCIRLQFVLIVDCWWTVQRHSNPRSAKYVCGIFLAQGWRAFWRAFAQIVFKFRRNSFACPWEVCRAKEGLGAFHNYYQSLLSMHIVTI